MSSRVAQRHAAGSYDSCDSRVSASGRLITLVAALMIALATLFVGIAMPRQASAADGNQTNFDSWTAVAQNIAKQLATAEKDYNDGDYGQAGTGFQTAHWIGYDASNFSKAVNDTISADKQQALLTQFTDLEGLAYQQGQGSAIANGINALNADLDTAAQTLDGNANLADPKTYAKQRAEQTAAERKKLDAATLDGGAVGNVNAFTKAITSSAGQAFLILIREGLEALLVVAAVVAYLVKSGNQRFTKWIYLGVLAGLAGSGLVAVLFTFLFGGSGPIQEISEGVCALIAMLMLLWTSNWMLNKSSVEAWNRYIRTKTESAVADAQNKVAAGEGVGLGMVVSLAMLSFLAVFREGAETVIFYESIYSMSRDAQGMWIGGIAAGVVLLVIFLVLRFTSVKIPIGPFFFVTSILMAVLVVIFAGGGIHALIEGDLIDGHYLSSVPTNDWIGLYPYVECLAAQAIAAIAVLALFAVGFARKRKLRTPDNRK